MKSVIKKPIAVILLLAVAVSFVIGLFAFSRSTKYLQMEIEDNLLNTTEKYANDFSAQFNHMEGLTDSLASYVMTSFDMDAYNASPEEYMDEYEKELSDVIVSNLKNTKNAHSLYVTFSPDLTEVAREVWYVLDENGKAEEISYEYISGDRSFSLPYSEEMAYFFEPQGKDYGIWISPYIDADINQEVFSYSHAIYVDGVFLGVAGADINSEDIIKDIHELTHSSSAYATLFDTDYEMIVDPSDITDEEKQIITRKLVQNTKDSTSDAAGIVKYSDSSNSNIMAYSLMDNKWTMAVIQSRMQAYEPVNQFTTLFLILVVLMFIAIAAFLQVFYKPFIKKQAALEKHNQEKDLMLMYQSRHAKIGEMFENITNQWRQPLSTINMIMSNLLDSFRSNKLSEDRLQKSVKNVADIVNSMSETIDGFSGFLVTTKEKTDFDPLPCVYAAISLMESSINQYNIKVKVNNSCTSKIHGYSNELVHIILNILDNARDAIVHASPDERIITIDIVEIEGNIQIQISNSGDKISEEVFSKIYEPYFTTKEASDGTGLGLFISRQIAQERLNGSLSIENTAKGVLCTITVPAADNKTA